MNDDSPSSNIQFANGFQNKHYFFLTPKNCNSIFQFIYINMELAQFLVKFLILGSGIRLKLKDFFQLTSFPIASLMPHQHATSKCLPTYQFQLNSYILFKFVPLVAVTTSFYFLTCLSSLPINLSTLGINEGAMNWNSFTSNLSQKNIVYWSLQQIFAYVARGLNL